MVVLLAMLGVCWAPQPPSRPNIILIVCDNLGYGDVEPFAKTPHRTPELARMAREGMRLTHCYSASGVCTPSRAALLTGKYPLRVGLAESDGLVLRPVSHYGLHPQQTTIAEVLHEAGYVTAAMGKWHLGDQRPFLPTRQGFDRFLGIPYSDDMTPRANQPWPPLPWMVDERVVEAPVDRRLLTRRLTQAALDWIERHRRRPFFLYLPMCMPGSTKSPFASEDFRGRSANGAWGDSVEELDWSAGRILEKLRELKIAERTLVVWTSDNGAPCRNPPQGSNGQLGGWGYTTAEGGMRVPCLAWQPTAIAPGRTVAELTTLMDWTPTFAALAATSVTGRLDGRDIRPLLYGSSATMPPHPGFLYYRGEQLEAVRQGRWKLYLPTGARKGRLYDVVADPAEAFDRIDEHQADATRLRELANRLADRAAATREPIGYIADPKPLQLTDAP